MRKKERGRENKKCESGDEKERMHGDKRYYVCRTSRKARNQPLTLPEKGVEKVGEKKKEKT